MGTIVRWLKGEAIRSAQGRAALRARHRQGDAGGRGRVRPACCSRSRVREGEVPVGQTVAVIGEAGEEVDRAPTRGAGPRPVEAPRASRCRGAGAPRPRPPRGSRRPVRRTAAGSRPRRSRARIARERGVELSVGSRYRHRTAASSPRTSSAPSRAGTRRLRPHPRWSRRGRVGPALERPQDDRAQADGGVAGARVPARRSAPT